MSIKTTIVTPAIIVPECLGSQLDRVTKVITEEAGCRPVIDDGIVITDTEVIDKICMYVKKEDMGEAYDLIIAAYDAHRRTPSMESGAPVIFKL